MDRCAHIYCCIFEVSIKAPRKNAAGLADTIAQFLEGRDLLALL